MKAWIFVVAALAGTGAPTLAESVIGTVPADGGRLVAISLQLPDGSLSTPEKNALTFDVLSDIGNAVARLAIFTFNRAVALLGSSAATAIIALLRAVASLLAISVLSERPAPIEFVATIIIIGAVLLAARRPDKPKATGPERRVT